MPTPDPQVSAVVDFFLQWNGFAAQAATTLRRALDEVIDGMRTGRWSVDLLEKTEKTYIGTKVEILFKFEFELDDGSTLDTSIQGHEVDIKCTVLRDWMIPKEAVNKLCLLVRIDEKRSRYWIGVVRASSELLRKSANRDGKTSLSAEGRKSIKWLVEAGELPVNFLATLEQQTREQILQQPSGQLRINALFRSVHNRIIPRVAIETVARQKDPMKRVRDARKILKEEGLLILGHQDDDPAIARDHGVPVPQKGEFIVVNLPAN